MKDGRVFADKKVVHFSSGQHHKKHSTLIFRALVKRVFFPIEIWLVQVSNVFNFNFRQLLWLLLTNNKYSINKQQTYLEFSIQTLFAGKSRRIIFKKSATRAPTAVAKAVTSDRVYYHGQYFTKGNWFSNPFGVFIVVLDYYSGSPSAFKTWLGTSSLSTWA